VIALPTMALAIDPVPAAIVTLSLAALWLAAGWHKLADPEAFERSLEAYDIAPQAMLPWLEKGLPVLELALAAGLLIPPTRPAAGVLGALVLLGYGAAIAFNLRRGRRDLDCGCVGFGARTQISPALVGRNAFAAFASLSAGLLPRTERIVTWIDIWTISPVPWCWRSFISPWRRCAPRVCDSSDRADFMLRALIVSNVLLWALVLVLAGVVLALVRQIGVLHERIAPAGALLLKRGLKVGEPVPVMALTDLSGRGVTIGAPSEHGRSTLLVFLSPTCPVCKLLLPVLKSSRASESDWLELILASDGAQEEHRRFVGANGLREIPYVLSAELGMRFQVERLPFAAIVDEGGVLRARGLINSREHLESLFEAKRLGVASLQEFLQASADSQAAQR
jgi:methylamine dehydrogenase accessory protein MauD